MSIGPMQLLLILGIIVLLFGTGKLPKLMSELGRGLKSLRDGLKDGEDSGNEPDR